MKQNIKAGIVTLLFFFVVPLLAQSGAQSISIKSYATDELKKFENNDAITKSDIDKRGVILKVDAALSVKTVSLTSKNGMLSSITKKKTESGVDFYKFQGAFVDDKNKITITLCKDSKPENCVKILLDVQVPAAAPVNEKSDCYTSLFKTEDCNFYDLKNDFGFGTDDFDEGDVIYIYDFNKDESKRRFYKKMGNNKAAKVNMSKEHLCHDKQIYFKIVGLNQFIYEATVDDALVSYDSEPSILFNRMFLGDSTSLVALMETNDAFAQSGDERIPPILKQVRCFYDMYADLKAEIAKAYDPCACFPECNQMSFTDLIKKRNEISTGITLLELDNSSKRKELKALQQKEADCTEFKKLTTEIAALNAKGNKTPEEAAELVAKTAKLAKITCETDLARAGIVKELESELSVIDGLTAIKTALPSEESIKAAAIFVMNMVKQNQSYWKGPIQLDGNILEFSLDIKKRDYVVNTFSSPPYSMHLKYELPIYGKPFVSFSSGSFVAVGNHLRDKTYDWQPTALGSTGYRLVETGYTELPVGFAALGNVEWKISRNIGFGPSVGVGITIEDKARVVYLAGLSGFIGEWRQFTITGGLAAMQVDKLNVNLKSMADSQTISATELNLDYQKNLRVGPFISLSYTPFKPKRKEKETTAANPTPAAQPTTATTTTP